MTNEKEIRKCKICGKEKPMSEYYAKTYTCKRCVCEMNARKSLAKHLSENPNLPNEVWKDVVGYEGLYEVSNKGRIRSFVRGGKCGCILSLVTHRQGYKEIKLSSNTGCKSFLVHRLVAEAFIHNPEDKETVNHIDGNKANNTVENLEWATINENIAHAYRTGLRTFPEKRLLQMYEGQKLTKHDVEEIRAEFKEGVRQKDLADRYNVSRAQICRIVNGLSRQQYLNSNKD